MYGDYRDQLDTWIKKTGKTQKELAAFSAYFFSLEKPLAEAQITNAKKVPPSREDGRRNLYIVMGLLNAYGVIDEVACKSFFENYDVAYEEDGSWQDIWRRISEGAEAVRQVIAQRASSDYLDPNAISQNRFNVLDSTQFWAKIVSLLLVLSLCGVGFLAVVHLVRSLGPAYKWCVASPLAIQTIGEIPRLYFAPQIRLDNFQIAPYYIYFNGEFVDDPYLDLEGFEVAENRWVVKLDRNWMDLHPTWSQPELWRVNYVC